MTDTGKFHSAYIGMNVHVALPMNGQWHVCYGSGLSISIRLSSLL